MAGRLWECAAFIRAFDLRKALKDGSAGDESAVKTTHSQTNPNLVNILRVFGSARHSSAL